jgi:NAD(P)-dependent dehydrogenase (short-subunit alcohol dehydrogenase family)
MQAIKMSSKKSVLVTGSAVRLGAALAECFANDNWRVFCHYDKSIEAVTQLVDKLSRSGKEVIALQADLSSDSGCQMLMKKVKQHVDKLDCLVNNASAFEPDAADDFDAGNASRQLQVNLMAPMSLSKWMAQTLVGGEGVDSGCIIHILDQKILNLNPDYFTYTLSKLALERAVALQAQALAPRIRVCGVAPGLMFLSGPQTTENFDKASKANLLRRATDSADVAKTCLFLASTVGITGCTIAVDNGQHLVPLPRDIMFVVEDLLKEKLT